MPHYRVRDGLTLTCPTSDTEYRRIIAATKKGEEIEDRKEITVKAGELCDDMPAMAIASYLESGHIEEVDSLGRLKADDESDGDGEPVPEVPPTARRSRAGRQN